MGSVALSSSGIVSEAAASTDHQVELRDNHNTHRFSDSYSDKVYFDTAFGAEESIEARRAVSYAVEIEALDTDEEPGGNKTPVSVRFYASGAVESLDLYGNNFYSYYREPVPAIRMYDLDISVPEDKEPYYTGPTRPEWAGVWHSGMKSDKQKAVGTWADKLLSYGVDQLENTIGTAYSVVKDTIELAASIEEVFDTTNDHHSHKYYYNPRSQFHTFGKFEMDLYESDEFTFDIQQHIETLRAQPVNDHDSWAAKGQPPGFNESFYVVNSL